MGIQGDGSRMRGSRRSLPGVHPETPRMPGGVQDRAGRARHGPHIAVAYVGVGPSPYPRRVLGVIRACGGFSDGLLYFEMAATPMGADRPRHSANRPTI